jgi:hypothetical protein
MRMKSRPSDEGSALLILYGALNVVDNDHRQRHTALDPQANLLQRREDSRSGIRDDGGGSRHVAATPAFISAAKHAHFELEVASAHRFGLVHDIRVDTGSSTSG